MQNTVYSALQNSCHCTCHVITIAYSHDMAHSNVRGNVPTAITYLQLLQAVARQRPVTETNISNSVIASSSQGTLSQCHSSIGQPVPSGSKAVQVIEKVSMNFLFCNH